MAPRASLHQPCQSRCLTSPFAICCLPSAPCYASVSIEESFFMCGIVGYIGPKKVVPVVIEGLRKLEYRGYDSAGIAVVGTGGKLDIRRAPGKLRNLEEIIAKSPLDGTYGIGHTRWATHGRPTEEN